MEDEELVVEKKKTVKRKVYIPVNLIKSKGKVSIFQWVEDGKIKRGLLPIGTKMKNGKIDETVLNTAIPFGVPWESFEADPFDGEKLAEELHNKGIWTLEDAENNLQVFGQTLLVVMKSTRNDLLKFAKQFDNPV